MDFRKRTIEQFALVFSRTEQDDNITTGEEFSKKWGWFGIMYNLTKGEIVNLNNITNLSLYVCLTWLTYEADLNELKSVNNGK